VRHFMTALIFTLGIISIICWAEPNAYLQALAESSSEGQDLFKQRCLACHSEEGAGEVLTTDSRTADEWKAYFAEGKHMGIEMTLLIDEKNLKPIAEFCIKNAKKPPKTSTP